MVHAHVCYVCIFFLTVRDSYRGEGEGGLPPPPPLNQHKYYNKVVLKHKKTTVAAKRYASVQRHL